MSSRLIETLKGKGDIFKGEARAGRVEFHIERYQRMIDDTLPSGIEEFRGRIWCDPSLMYRLMEAKMLTLHLETGRQANIMVEDMDGNIKVSGPIMPKV